MRTIEYSEGRIKAFTEARELLSMITTTDETTAGQLKILINHLKRQIELETRYIDIDLELMESANC